MKNKIPSIFSRKGIILLYFTIKNELNPGGGYYDRI